MALSLSLTLQLNPSFSYSYQESLVQERVEERRSAVSSVELVSFIPLFFLIRKASHIFIILKIVQKKRKDLKIMKTRGSFVWPYFTCSSITDRTSEPNYRGCDALRFSERRALDAHN